MPVLEGYGATEAAPVIAVNKPDDNRRGTVGGLLPGQEFRVEPVEGISGGGKLLVRGPNIMLGYLREDGGVDAPDGGWHDTGDVVSMSDDRWITIKGRVKRFAKIAGEMVSLTAAEDLASAVWPDGRHAVISMPDKKRARNWFWSQTATMRRSQTWSLTPRPLGLPGLAVPRKILKVPEVPVLGSGKTDYVAIQRMADQDARAA